MGSCDRSQPSGMHRTQRASITKEAGRPLQTPVSLTPPVFIDDIGERDTANWPELPHRVADWQQSIGMDVRRQSECRLRFLLELQVQRRQCRTEPRHIAPLRGWFIRNAEINPPAPR